MEAQPCCRPGEIEDTVACMQDVGAARVLHAEGAGDIVRMCLLPATSTLLLLQSGATGFSTLQLDS